MSVLEQIPRTEIEKFCQKWRILELSFFGSILRPDFSKSSDIDVLVKFESPSPWSLWDHAEMEAELSALLKRKVDLVSKSAVEKSRNPIRKKQILGSAKIYYAA